MCAAEKERSPLRTLQGANYEMDAATPEPENVKGRQTWGSLKSIVGRGSRWVSTGYWDKQGKDDKIFI
jgi:axial budding pattern protein 2